MRRWAGELDWARSSLIIAVGVLVLMTNVLVPTLVGVYVDDFGLLAHEAGYTAAIYMAGGGLGALIVSGLLLRVRTRLLLAVGLATLAVGNLASIYAQSLESILAVRLLAGLGEGAGFALMGAGIARMRNPTRVYGTFIILMLIAASILQYSVPWLRATFGERALFVPIALAPACLLLFLAKFPELSSRPSSDGGATSFAVPGLGNFWWWSGALATFVVYVAYGGAFAYVERIGVQAGVDRDAVARVLGLGHFIAMGGALAAILTANTGRRMWKIAGALVLVTCATLLVTSGKPEFFTVGVVSWFLFWQFFAPNLLGLLAQLDPSGRLSAASLGTMECGLAAGPAIAALCIREGTYAAVGVMAAAGYLITLLLLLPGVRHSSRSMKSQRRPGSNPVPETAG